MLIAGSNREKFKEGYKGIPVCRNYIPFKFSAKQDILTNMGFNVTSCPRCKEITLGFPGRTENMVEVSLDLAKSVIFTTNLPSVGTCHHQFQDMSWETNFLSRKTKLHLIG